MTRKLFRALGALSLVSLCTVANAQLTFEPPEDGKDWIQLTSGEWLRGELIGLFDDVVEFDSEILEELTIDWEDVERINSPRTYGVNVSGERTLVGSLRFDGDQVYVVTESGATAVNREDLIGITKSAQRERDRWTADITIGFNAREGNARFIEQSTLASIERRTPNSRTNIDYVGSFNETEGVRVANSHRVTGTLDRFSNSRLFWRPLNIQYNRDEFQNIAHQATLSTGLGFELKDTSKTDWQVYASAGANYLQRVSVEPGEEEHTTSPSLTVGTDFETDLTSWIEYLFQYRVTFLDEEAGKRQHHLVSTVSTHLIGNIDFDVSFIWDRTDSPQPDAGGDIPKADDFRLNVGIGFEF